MGRTKFVDPDRWIISLAGIRIQGWADGEFLTYKRKRKGFEKVTGTDGEHARSKILDKSGEFVCKLLQSSDSNKDLSALHNLDLNAPNGAGVGAFLVQDLNGLTVISAAQAWIVSFPDGSNDRTAKSRDWEIETGDCFWFEGGN